jgi:phenylpropionate dioxygenase-like ring-hydroxylating dioxygenase large terminal subunit
MAEIEAPTIIETAPAQSRRARDLRDDVPEIGYANYWYPAVPSSWLRRRPHPLRLLGRDIVLFRSGGRVHALEDRCAHKGTPLSIGKVRFPGTITCAYHGWTYDGRGECVAALHEGPQSRVPGRACVLAYPVEERAGTVWIFVGDQDPPPIEQDMPSKLREPGLLVFPLVINWKANWRLAMENVADPSHDNTVHRASARNFFKRVRIYNRMEVAPNERGDGFYISPGFVPEVPGTEFGALGRFPKRTWWRRLNGAVRPTLGGRYMSEIRLPGFLQVNTYPWMMVQWSVPVDATTSRQYLWFVWQRGKASEPLARLYWRLSYCWVMRQFLSQDQWVVEAQERGQAYSRQERLSRNDVGVTAWRRLASSARR